MISINNLTVEFSGTPLFNEVSFLINPRDRIGLTGKNGAGKSTLLKIICGLHGYDKGQIAIPKDVTIGYLPQQMTVSDTKTVFKEALGAFIEIKSLEDAIKRLNVELGNRTDFESSDYLELIHQLTEKTDRFKIGRAHV